MKMRKNIAILLLLAMFTIVLCSCDVVKVLFPPKETPDNSEQPGDSADTDTPEQSDDTYDNTNEVVPPTFLDPIWYSITTDTDEYDFGEEITVSVSIKLSRNRAFYFEPDVKQNGVATIAIAESEYYEICGNDIFVFEDVCLWEYVHEREASPYTENGGKSFECDFKIKINRPDFCIADAINISFGTKLTIPAADICLLDFNDALTPLRFVTDSKGVLFSSIPYSSNYWKYGIEEPLKFNYVSILDKSFNREYENGIAMEELIDRYNRMFLGNSVYFNINNHIDTHSNRSVVYISEGVRFIIYVPQDHAYIDYDADGEYSRDRVSYLKKILKYAYDSGILTADEYAIESNRLDLLTKDDLINALHNWNWATGQFFTGENVQFPEDDSYYNYVFDLR